MILFLLWCAFWWVLGCSTGWALRRIMHGRAEAPLNWRILCGPWNYIRWVHRPKQPIEQWTEDKL